MYVIIRITYSISYCKDNIKCDSASHAPIAKCSLNNGVSMPSFKNLWSNSQTLQQRFRTGGNNIVEVFESLNDGHTVV